MTAAQVLLEPLFALHQRLRDEIVAATERQHMDSLAAVAREDTADTIYAIDVAGEAVIEQFAAALGRDHSFVLVAEGLPGGRQSWGGDDTSAEWVIILDPIDGTRGLMYQKRSAWVLTAVAPNRGPATSLRDVVLAIQTEIPLVKQHLSDQLWAARGGGAAAQRYNRLTKETAPIRLRPSTAATIEHGYASIVRFFPGARDELAAIDEAIVFGTLGPNAPGKAHCFEDQYTSTGGQLYELVAGHDRFVADLRPMMRPLLDARGLPPALTCHPYDICTALIAEESGVIITDPSGGPIDAPLNVDAEVAWVGYANGQIRDQIEPVLQGVLRSRGFMEGRPATSAEATVATKGRPLPEAEGGPLPEAPPA